MEDARAATGRDARAATDRATIGLASEAVIGSLGGTDSAIQPSSVVTSGARPGDPGNAVGSAAGRLSITVKRVFVGVPFLASTAPSLAAENTICPHSCRLTNES